MPAVAPSRPSGRSAHARPARVGREIELINGDITAKTKRLHGTEMFLGGPFGSTVLGTANAMMAAALAEGVSVIEMAACEPEVVRPWRTSSTSAALHHWAGHAADRHRGRQGAARLRVHHHPRPH